MLVDSHIHLYPPVVCDDPAAWARKQDEPYWLSCVSPAIGKSLQAWKSVDELLRDMDQASVEKAIVMAWYWENHDSCVRNLDWQIKWIQAHPERLIAFAPFNARGGQAALEELQRAFEHGLKGIGELNPPAQGYAYDDPTLAQALEIAAHHDAAVTFHVTDPTTQNYPGKIETPFPSLLKLARDHPDTQFIFAHLGGGEPLRQNVSISPNISFDTAACPLLYKTPAYREFCDTVGSDKILFGSDYPLRVFPKNPDSPDFLAPLSELAQGSLNAQELGKIRGENIARILKLT